MLAHVVLAESVELVAHQIIDVAAVGQLLVLKVLGTAVGGAAQHEHALALLFGVGQVGADGVQTHVGCQRDEVGLEVAGKVTHGVHLGSLGDIAALDVGDDRDASLAHSLQGVGVGLHALHAQRLIISDLYLVAAGHSLGGINELLVEAHDVLALGQGAVHKIGGQVAEIGVQTHTHRAAGLNSFVQFVHVRHLGVLLFALFYIRYPMSYFPCVSALSVTTYVVPPLPPRSWLPPWGSCRTKRG